MNLSRLKIPLDETGIEITVEIKDAFARERIAAIAQNTKGTLTYLGETATPIASGSSVNPIEINGEFFTVTSGTCVTSHNTIYLYDGKIWRTFGSASALRALAYKDEVSAEYEPQGTITRPLFTGKAATVEATIIPRGRIELSQEDSTEEEANFVAEGQVTAPRITVVPKRETITAFTNGGRLPSCTFPKLTMHLEGENLVFGLEEGSFDPGSSPSGGQEISVVTDIEEVKASEPQFIGKPKKLSGSFSGQSSSVELEYTPEGEITTPLFRGTPATIISR